MASKQTTRRGEEKQHSFIYLFFYFFVAIVQKCFIGNYFYVIPSRRFECVNHIGIGNVKFICWHLKQSRAWYIDGSLLAHRAMEIEMLRSLK